MRSIQHAVTQKAKLPLPFAIGTYTGLVMHLKGGQRGMGVNRVYWPGQKMYYLSFMLGTNASMGYGRL